MCKIDPPSDEPSGTSGDELCGADILIELQNGHLTGIEPTINTLMCSPSCVDCDAGTCGPLSPESQTTSIRMNFRLGEFAPSNNPDDPPPPPPPVGPRRVATLFVNSDSATNPAQVFANGVWAAGAKLQLRPIANAVGACVDEGEPFSCCTGKGTSTNDLWPCGRRLIAPVPEPGQIWQLVSGLAGLGCLYRLRRRA